MDRYFFTYSKKYIIYLTNNNYDGGAFSIENHLLRYRTIMEKRRENQQGKIKYYHLHWPKKVWFFEPKPKILSVRKCEKPIFCYTKNDSFTMMANNIIITDRVNLKYLTCLLNSKLIEFWLKYNGKMQGSNFQVDKEPLLDIPIKVPTSSVVYEELFDEISKSKIELHELESNFLSSIYSRLSIERKVKRIDDFEFISYEDFIYVLKEEKQNIPPISDDAEWRDFINKSIQKRRELKNSIDFTEDKINKEIFNLYEINKEELLNHLQ